MSRRQLALTAAAALVLLGVSVAIGRSLISSPSVPARNRPAAPTPPRPAGFIRVQDRQAGFSLAYPGTWRRLQTSDKEVRLLVADGTKVSLLVRVTAIGLTVTKDTLPIARDLTDSLVRADRGVTLLSQPAAITLDGLPGYRYVYTLAAGPNGGRAAHVHYFVFNARKRLISLVFQVPDVRAMRRDLRALDRVAGTFVTIG